MQKRTIPRLDAKFSYKAYRVGQSQAPLLIIDNFIEEADSLVAYCQANCHFDNNDRFYPGQRMAAPARYTQALLLNLAGVFEAVFQLPPHELAGAKTLYSLVTTPPEALLPQQCLPHVDSVQAGDLACVHYLCSADKGGTSLYRHRQTGLEVIGEEAIANYNQTLIDQGVLALPKAYMNGSNDYFEQIASVDAQFNRLVVYPSNILHSGNIAADFKFDPNPLTGRLTLNSFIYSKR